MGGGARGSSGAILITGGDVKATGGASTADDGGAGIGGGFAGDADTITITGGTVIAMGYTSIDADTNLGRAAGIGGGYGGNGGVITITGGDITAIAGQSGTAAAVGPGSIGSDGTVTISPLAYRWWANQESKAPEGQGVQYPPTAYFWSREHKYIRIETLTEENPETFKAAFPDALFRAKMLAYLNLDGGNRTDESLVSDADKAFFASIDVITLGADSQITDLTGLSYFTSLTILDCSYNQLTFLDVTVLPLLERLYCQGNDLTILDVTKNPALIELYCYDNAFVSPEAVEGWQEAGLVINSPGSLDTGTFRYYYQKTDTIITILSQPEDMLVNFQDGILIGSDTLSIAAEARPETELTYTWYQRLGEEPDPAKDRLVGNEAALSIAPLLPQSLDVGYYYFYCVVGAENAFDIISRVAEVLVSHAITDPGVQILTQPAANTFVTEGEIEESLYIDAIPIGTDEVYYQWYSNTVPSNEGGTLIEGATSPTFAIPADLTAIDSPYYFYCEASVVFTSEFSDVAKVVVVTDIITDPGVQILTQPAANTVVTEGEIAESLCIEAIPLGTDEVYYQWYSNTVPSNEGGTLIEGATSSVFEIPTDLTAEDSPYYFYCEASVVFTSEFSDVAEVEVLAPSETFTVTFDLGFEIVFISVKSGMTVPRPVDPAMYGYDFVGWFLDDVEFDFDSPITSDITLIARWEQSGEKEPPKVFINGVEVDYEIIDGTIVLKLTYSQIYAILNMPGLTVTIDIQETGSSALDLYAPAPVFNSSFKTIRFLTADGSVSVNCASLWSNSLGMRVIEVRGTRLGLRNI
ncbi:MAG: InlB B-repeat-containing protein [Clostridiales bacterium]|nr:InlB B-repeat-containing protein [Clostridiales bacterium]